MLKAAMLGIKAFPIEQPNLPNCINILEMAKLYASLDEITYRLNIGESGYYSGSCLQLQFPIFPFYLVL